jgi:hypothetical protein
MDKDSLLENEGINAGSAQQLADAEKHVDAGDARSGGRPDQVDDVETGEPMKAVDRRGDDADSALLGSTDEGDRSPEPLSGSGGQDAGNIE